MSEKIIKTMSNAWPWRRRERDVWPPHCLISTQLCVCYLQPESSSLHEPLRVRLAV
jgi:hypothetical protein